MSGSTSPIPEDLLDRLIESLAAADSPESPHSVLDELRSLGASQAFEELEAAAAATSLAFGVGDTAGHELPSTLRSRCLEAAATHGLLGGSMSNGTVGSAHHETEPAIEPPTVTIPAERRPLRFQAPSSQNAGSPIAARLGWLAAAACLAIAAAAWWPASPAASAGSADGSRDALIAGAEDLVRWDWAAWDDGYENVAGDVVWSESRQEGYMLLTGLPANDPAESQYQLWVVESSRGTPLQTEPVDGGVFDVPAAGGDVVVPIRAKLHSEGVAAFAVTLEPAGGVVVSDQSRRVVIAAPPPPSG